MERALMEKPFAAELVKTRTGHHGQALSYVEAVHYIKRLNEVFDAKWSWRILEHEINGSEVMVHGALEAGGQEKHAFGGAMVTLNKATGEVVSISDDLKAAATDALKKACSLFGIGLDLYGMSPSLKERGGTKPELRTVPRSRPTEPPASSPGRTEEPSPGARLTAKQLKALYAIARNQGMTDDDLKGESLKIYGVVPQFLTKGDASSFIEALNAR